ncbi:hypothetical protein [Sphingobium sp. WCS2017Hpa-17]|uniref:hypothetical protein n=1 Tax=Sphingobium sp. WCS2017Hpa-17 TaxID=3073638 RepID=UPI00288C4ABC|nr:hypothetical protein [Sphingobium sp. WCS2017Hpa-17]
MNVNSPIIQSIGLACVPLHDMPAKTGGLGRKPVAAAVVTLQERDDGQCDIIGARMSDAMDMEFPLAWRIEQELMPNALTIVSAEDRAILGAEAAARRFFVEPRLARVCAGKNVVDPCSMLGEGGVDEQALGRRLSVPTSFVSDKDVQAHWSRHAPQAAEEVALARAVGRMILWANLEAFRTSEPRPFFRTLLPLQTWMYDQAERAPSLYRMATARPLMRAASFAAEWRAYEEKKAQGDPDASWVSFEIGLFHS